MFKITEPFFIAEVGANHQGRLDLALEYITKFAALGASAIKFQVRTNDTLFSREMLEKPYDHPNSFGATYGDHRAVLELSSSDLKRLKERCVEVGVYFICTAFDELAIDRLIDLEVDAIKVSSFDLGNFSFLDKLASTELPVIFSTGGGGWRHIEETYSFFRERAPVTELAILHCVSKYPCKPEELHLGNIFELKNKFQSENTFIGLSDHFNGILSGPIGATFGATIFEKHVTFDRSWKGTDHAFALEPRGFEQFVRDIKRVELMARSGYPEDVGGEPVFSKLGKILTASREIRKGEPLSLDNVVGKICGIVSDGIPVRESHQVLGCSVTEHLSPGDILKWSNLSRE